MDDSQPPRPYSLDWLAVAPSEIRGVRLELDVASMTDHAEVRRDARARWEQYVHAALATEQTHLSFDEWLLADLEQAEFCLHELESVEARAEQAERERDAEAERAMDLARLSEEQLARAVTAEARLASVPALVEALRQIADYGTERQKAIAARDTLTVYEQSQQGGTK